MDASPLSTHVVIRQIVEHSVDAVATQNNVSVGIAVGNESSVDIDACIGREVECGAGGNGERCRAVDGDAPIYNNRCSSGTEC